MSTIDPLLKRLLVSSDSSELLTSLRNQLEGSPDTGIETDAHFYSRVFIDTLRSTTSVTVVARATEAVLAVISDAVVLPELADLPGLPDILTIARNLDNKRIALRLCDLLDSNHPAVPGLIENYGDLIFEIICGPLEDDDVYWRVVKMFLESNYDEFKPTMFFRQMEVRGVIQEAIAARFVEYLDGLTLEQLDRVQQGYSAHLSAVDFVIMGETGKVSATTGGVLLKHLLFNNPYSDKIVVNTDMGRVPPSTDWLYQDAEAENDLSLALIDKNTDSATLVNRNNRFPPLSISNPTIFARGMVECCKSGVRAAGYISALRGYTEGKG